MNDSNSKIEVLGRVLDCLPGAQFKVEIEDENYPSGLIVQGHLSGKMRVNYIKIIPGDYVNIELSPYDMTKGSITFRHKSRPSAERSEAAFLPSASPSSEPIAPEPSVEEKEGENDSDQQ